MAEHDEYWLVINIAKESYNCLIFQGVKNPVPYPISPLWIRACPELPRIDLFLEPYEPAHDILEGLNGVPLNSLISKICAHNSLINKI